MLAVKSKVAVCEVSECLFNEDGVCTAKDVTFDKDANCLTYQHSKEPYFKKSRVASVSICHCETCVYNKGGGCTAFIVTIEQKFGRPVCGTFLPASEAEDNL